ncbi:MAG: after-VIT domain-containing protein [Desmonostoc vinosum HA7617-LM4]|jgi:Ca-activated chloride channel family protein|nr:after-VIT domain-containing protein [Desmonostoc vinosum HA7617-LM4]
MNTATTKNQQLAGLYVKSPQGEQLTFPLEHTEVLAKIVGNLSRVDVIQTFENPFTQPLEAIYVFPLPDEAAVDDMEIKIGNSIIKGNIKKREEAQQIYEQAKQAGRTAGLLEQERDNIFTQSLANIKPGEQIDVTIRYTDSLKFAGGNYEFVFPMVVGPRYIPGTPIDGSGDTDRVPDASRITPPVISEGVPTLRSRHDIHVTVEIDAGMPIAQVRSPSHQLEIAHIDGIVQVKLAQADTIPNKDLILRYQVSTQETQSTALTQADDLGGHFAVYLIPALEYHTDEIVPKDVVFLVDTSGSQSGEPLQKCQELMRRLIDGLNPQDTFTIVDFSHSVRQLSPKPLRNTSQNRTKAIAYINKLRASGGTEMLSGILAAINVPTPPERLRTVILLTDGYIGNENEILAEVQKHLQSGNRLHSFGAGSSVNRFLLNRIAEIGRGKSTIIRHDEPTEGIIENFYKQINNPVLTNIQVSWQGDGESPVIYPSTAPDLFAEQPLVLFGRKQDRTSGNLQISGIAAGGKHYQKTFHLIFAQTANPAVAQLWGRSRIKDLMNQMVSFETKAGTEAVTETALTYQLLCQYTAFVAVSDDMRVEPGSECLSMQVPVEMPEAVSYQGVFGNAPAGGMVRRITLSSMPPVPAPASAAPPELEAKLNFPFSPFEESEINSTSLDISQDIGEISAVIKVISAIGLEQSAIAYLTQHLQQLNLPPGLSGQIVFEFTVKKGRVARVMLNEKSSTLKDTAILDMIKRSLLIWRVPSSTSNKVVLTLNIHT